jgi:hypothetical protein
LSLLILLLVTPYFILLFLIAFFLSVLYLLIHILLHLGLLKGYGPQRVKLSHFNTF